MRVGKDTRPCSLNPEDPWVPRPNREPAQGPGTGRLIGSLGPEENMAGLTPRTACVGTFAQPTDTRGTGRQQGFIRARA